MKIWSKSFAGQFLSFVFAFAFFTGAIAMSAAYASGDGECHFHGNKPAAEETVLKCADINKNRLIKKGTIDSSWASIKHESIQQIDVKAGKKEWKVVFMDPAAKDKAKAKLYMFFSIPGNFLASNFTGN